MRFFEVLGSSVNEKFANEEAASLVISDTIYAMLHMHASITRFTYKDIDGSATSTESLLARHVRAQDGPSRRVLMSSVQMYRTAHARTHTRSSTKEIIAMYRRIQSSGLLSSCSLIRVFAIAAIVLLLVSACGGSRETATPVPAAPEPATATPEPTAELTVEPTIEPAAEAAQEPAVEPTQQTPAEPAAQTSGLTVAVNANFKPFLFTDENGNLDGFDIDIMNALSAAGNFEVGYEDRPFEGMIDALAAGDYDAAMSAITINDTRKELVDFTAPYFQPGQAPVSFFSAGQGIGVRNDETEIASKDDLAGGTIVGVKRGTTGDEFASELESVTVVQFDESQQVLDALVDGAVDAAVVDIAVITDYIKESQGAVKLVGGPVTEEEYGIAVNMDRPDVLEMLNAALTQIRADGTYDAIIDKWFGAP